MRVTPPGRNSFSQTGMNSKSAKLFPSPDLDGAVARTASSESPCHALKNLLTEGLKKKQCQYVYFGEDQHFSSNGDFLLPPSKAKVVLRIECLNSLCFAIPLDTGQMDEFCSF